MDPTSEIPPQPPGARPSHGTAVRRSAGPPNGTHVAGGGSTGLGQPYQPMNFGLVRLRTA